MLIRYLDSGRQKRRNFDVTLYSSNLLFKCTQNIFIFKYDIFKSNTNQNVVNSTMINTKVPNIRLLFLTFLYKF